MHIYIYIYIIKNITWHGHGGGWGQGSGGGGWQWQWEPPRRWDPLRNGQQHAAWQCGYDSVRPPTRVV